MVWKNQERCESWLFGFSHFLSCHYGFTYYYEILNFPFSSIMPGEVSTCSVKYYLSRISSSRNRKLKKCKIQFYFCFALKTYSTLKRLTAWKVSKYRVISGPYFPVFSPNIEKYGPEITPYLDTFHAVVQIFSIWCLQLHAHAPAHAPLFWCV